jgi:hypothetical protein
VANYRVFIKPSAAKEIEAVGQKMDRRQIVAAIRSLGGDPRPAGCEKLSGERDRYLSTFPVIPSTFPVIPSEARDLFLDE